MIQKKILVAYYSKSFGNSERIALQVAKSLQADIEKIETIVPYPKEHEKVVKQGKEEIENGILPELQPLQYDVNKYDVIVLISPTWWYTMAPAMHSYMKANHWEGKIVVPVITHAGWPGHGILDAIKECTGAIVKTPLEIQFDSNAQRRDVMLSDEEEINRWITHINVLN